MSPVLPIAYLFILTLQFPYLLAYILHPGVKSLSTKFDYFIVDQWGVLHDGKTSYEGAIEALEGLRL